MSATEPSSAQLLELTSEIISAHVANNAVATADLPQMIAGVHAKLAALGRPAEPPNEPAVPVKRSVRKDAITCLECGRSMKMLKRHLGTDHELTPQEYRAKWNLPPDYPMVAPDYSERRQALARESGLGQRRGPRKRSGERKG